MAEGDEEAAQAALRLQQQGGQLPQQQQPPQGQIPPGAQPEPINMRYMAQMQTDILNAVGMTVNSIGESQKVMFETQRSVADMVRALEHNAPPVVQVACDVNPIGDLMPEAFSGSGDEDTEDFWRKFCTWTSLHETQIPRQQDKVSNFVHCLSKHALIWFNDMQYDHLKALKPNACNNTDQLKVAFYAKYRIQKTRKQLKTELAGIKYEIGQSAQVMINRFQIIANKLGYSNEIQILKLISIMPPSLKQFVVTKETDTMDHIQTSIEKFQEFIETETLSSTFKNVTFEESDQINTPNCSLCNKSHNSANCPQMIRKIIAECNANGSEQDEQKPEKSIRSDNTNGRPYSRERGRNSNQGRYSNESSSNRPRPYSPREPATSYDRNSSSRWRSPSPGDNFRGRYLSQSPSDTYQRRESFDRTNQDRPRRFNDRSRQYQSNDRSRQYQSNDRPSRYPSTERSNRFQSNNRYNDRSARNDQRSEGNEYQSDYYYNKKSQNDSSPRNYRGSNQSQDRPRNEGNQNRPSRNFFRRKPRNDYENELNLDEFQNKVQSGYGNNLSNRNNRRSQPTWGKQPFRGNKNSFQPRENFTQRDRKDNNSRPNDRNFTNPRINNNSKWRGNNRPKPRIQGSNENFYNQTRVTNNVPSATPNVMDFNNIASYVTNQGAYFVKNSDQSFHNA